VRPETLFAGHDVSAPSETEVFRDDRVAVKAIENFHFPERPKEKMMYRSFAYRFNMSDRSITEDVGRMAAEAKVKTVVLNHLLPGSNQPGIGDDAYIHDVKKFFAGEVIVGRDQMRIPR